MNRLDKHHILALAFGGLSIILIAMASPSMAENKLKPENGLDLLFNTKHCMQGSTKGKDRIDYDHTRWIIDEEKTLTNFKRLLTTIIDKQDENGLVDANIEIRQDERIRSTLPFKGVPGNPTLMVFLESLTKSLAKGTGGSPFYIQNRIKEAMRHLGPSEIVKQQMDNRDVEMHLVRFLPFKKDAQKGKWGRYQDLVVEIKLTRDIPCMFSTLKAVVPGEGDDILFREEIVFKAGKT